MKDQEVAKQFLSTIFPPKDIEDNHILIWTKNTPPKKGGLSYWHKGNQFSQAAARACDYGGDVYFSVGLSPKSYGQKKRCLQDDVAGIGCFWLDLDVAHDVHQKQNLPPDTERALGLIKGHGYDPSIILNSGHGLQAFWVFKEPWLFENEKDRQAARKLSQRMINTIRSRANDKDWTIDGVANLDRLMRIPGTENCKDPDKKKLVKVIEQNDQRYNPEDFEEMLDALSESEKDSLENAETTNTAIVNDLVFKEDALPPAKKLDDLMEIDPNFKSSWMKRRKFKSGKDSNSEYHMSLARIAAGAGWSDQDILNLLIAWNNRHNISLEKLKTHTKYLALTIQKARKKVIKSVGAKLLEDHIALSSGNLFVNGKDKRESARATILSNINLDVKRVIKFIGDTSKYRVILSNGEFTLPSINALMQLRDFKNHVADAIQKVIPCNKQDLWRPISQCLLDLVEIEEIDPQMTAKGQVKNWLLRYIRKNAFRHVLTRKEALINRYPYKHTDGHWYVFEDSFYEWTEFSANNRTLKQNKVRLALRDLGVLRTKRFRETIKGVDHYGTAWKIPKSITRDVTCSKPKNAQPQVGSLKNRSNKQAEPNSDEANDEFAKILDFADEIRAKSNAA